MLGLFELSTLLLNLSYKYPIMKTREVVEFFVRVVFLKCNVVSKVIQDNNKEILQSILRRRTTESAKEKILLAAS